MNKEELFNKVANRMMHQWNIKQFKITHKRLFDVIMESMDEYEALSIGGFNKCNCVKDPKIVKVYALINRKDGLTDVWCEGECLGKGLDTDGINKLNL